MSDLIEQPPSVCLHGGLCLLRIVVAVAHMVQRIIVLCPTALLVIAMLDEVGQKLSRGLAE